MVARQSHQVIKTSEVLGGGFHILHQRYQGRHIFHQKCLVGQILPEMFDENRFTDEVDSYNGYSNIFDILVPK